MTEHRRKYETGMQHVQHPDAAYDRSDLGASGIISFLIGLAITIIFIHFIAWGFIRTYAHFEPKAMVRSSAIIEPQPAPPQGDPVARFPAPQLQPDPVADLNKYREAVEQQLNSSGWLDQNNGVAHIPVERAIDIVAQRGLPMRPQQTQPQAAVPASGTNSVAGAGGGTEPSARK
jgi:hypothetical protein